MYSCRRGLISQTRLEKFVLEAFEMLIMQVELWEEVLGNNDDQVERTIISTYKYVRNSLKRLMPKAKSC